MKKSLLPALALMALSQIASAASPAPIVPPTPMYDLTGNWQPGGGGTTSYYQGKVFPLPDNKFLSGLLNNVTQVSFIYNNADFGHTFVGYYTTATVIKGTMQRTNRINQCVTTLSVTITLSADPTVISLDATAPLEKYCDLAPGNHYYDTNFKIL